MDKTESRQLTEVIVKILDGRKAKSIEVIHTEKLGAITDYFIICSGTSSTHLRGIADCLLYTSRMPVRDILHRSAHLCVF